MKILHLDLNMGAAGDMLSAALADIMENNEEFLRVLGEMNIPGAEMSLREVSRGGICGKAFSVSINGHEEDAHEHGHHHGHGMHTIRHIVSDLNADEDIKKNILDIYGIIAEAESKVHGVPVSEVHFHEVGMLDAVADIAAACLAMKMIAPDKITATPVHVGSGQVKCAHGILPVPAPATAEILKGIPIYGGAIRGELCTPTGAALLKYFVSDFGDMPSLSIEKVGYGMGKREFEAVNCVRAILGEVNENGDVSELRANIDDMTGEEISFAMEEILSGGALDVWTESIGMKKSRAGVLLCALCKRWDAEEIAKLFLQHTTTLGVREIKCTRRILSRKIKEVSSDYGTVRKKISEGYGILREKYEYEDIARIARENGTSIQKARELVSETEKN